MTLQRQFIKNATAYYMRHGYTYSEALRHANKDAQWWREQLTKLLEPRQ